MRRFGDKKRRGRKVKLQVRCFLLVEVGMFESVGMFVSVEMFVSVGMLNVCISRDVNIFISRDV